MKIPNLMAMSLCAFIGSTHSQSVNIDNVLDTLTPVEKKVEAALAHTVQSALESKVGQKIEQTVSTTIDTSFTLSDDVIIPILPLNSLVSSVTEPLTALPESLTISLDDNKQTAYIDVRLDDGLRAIQQQWLLVANNSQIATLKQHNATIISVKKYASLNINLVRFNVPKNLDTKEALIQTLQLKSAALLDRNHIYQAQTKQPTSMATPSPTTAFCSEKTRVGIIDSAINTQHTAFKHANIIRQRFLPTGLNSPSLHGTAIAGLLVGRDEKLWPLLDNAELYSAEVFYRQSEFAQGATLFAIVEALDWLVSQNVKVINMSLTGPKNAILHAGIKGALKQNTLIVAAAGNSGPAALPLYPAAYNNVIAVSAINSKKEVYRWSNKGEYIDFAAMGVNVITSKGRGGLGTESGTSIAAPHVSAALACLMAKTHNNNAQALALLSKQALDLGDKGKDSTFGIGAILRPKNAL
jgi:hypothetical protein